MNFFNTYIIFNNDKREQIEFVHQFKVCDQFVKVQLSFQQSRNQGVKKPYSKNNTTSNVMDQSKHRLVKRGLIRLKLINETQTTSFLILQKHPNNILEQDLSVFIEMFWKCWNFSSLEFRCIIEGNNMEDQRSSR